MCITHDNNHIVVCRTDSTASDTTLKRKLAVKSRVPIEVAKQSDPTKAPESNNEASAPKYRKIEFTKKAGAEKPDERPNVPRLVPAANAKIKSEPTGGQKSESVSRGRGNTRGGNY